jgi:hypothetical protein
LYGLFVLLNESHGDTVKITTTVLRDSATTLGILFQNIDLLKGLEDLALDRAAGVDVVAGAGTAVNTATVELSEGTNTNAGAKVDVAGNRGSVDVEPVRVIGSKLFVGASLDNVDPLGDLKLASALEIGGVGLDEFCRETGSVKWQWRVDGEWSGSSVDRIR